jgi:hypothetical protein
MSHYRIIDSKIENDEKFNELPHLTQFVWFRLFNYRHNTKLGAYEGGRAGLAEHINMMLKQFNRHFTLLITQNFIRYDEKRKLVWFPKYLKHNQPESPNCVKGWDKVLDMLPDCKLKNEIIQASALWIQENKSEGFKEALPEAFQLALPKDLSHPSLNQKQNTETEINNNIILTPVITSAHDEIEIIANEENKKIFELPVKKGDNFPIFETDMTIFKNNFPAVDVKNELEKMKAWLTEKQFPKNYFSMREFVKSWLSKAQHESGNIRNFEKQGVKHYGKTSAINTKQPSPFEQAMSPGVQWAIAE